MANKESKLAKKLKRSLDSVSAVLRVAKSNGGDITDACRKMGKNPNYVNCALYYFRAVEKKNGIKIPEVQEIESAMKKIKGGEMVPDRSMGTHIGNALAGMKLAISKGISIATASKRMGKDPSYLSACFTMIGRMNATAEQKKEFNELKDEYIRMRASGDITKTKRRRRRSRNGLKRKYTKRTFAPAVSESGNALSHLVSGEVDFKYPVITDKPVTKEVKTYPLEVMELGHAFAVPAEKGHIIAVKKAVTLFARRNPGKRFLQKKDGAEFYTWRMA